MHHFTTGSKQDVDRLVDTALQLTWDMCFDGTRVMFKEPETLTLFKVQPFRLRVLSHTIWKCGGHLGREDVEVFLDPAEEKLIRSTRLGKSGRLTALKLRERQALEADKLFMKVSPMDFRLSKFPAFTVSTLFSTVPWLCACCAL